MLRGWRGKWGKILKNNITNNQSKIVARQNELRTAIDEIVEEIKGNK
ncbi:MAG: hypothetical protein P1P85_05690 [Patescibacteria group bacterium]|nr:hypothetical protein [Patescibacteria group bacterium]